MAPVARDLAGVSGPASATQLPETPPRFPNVILGDGYRLRVNQCQIVSAETKLVRWAEDVLDLAGGKHALGPKVEFGEARFAETVFGVDG